MPRQPPFPQRVERFLTGCHTRAGAFASPSVRGDFHRASAWSPWLGCRGSVASLTPERRGGPWLSPAGRGEHLLNTRPGSESLHGSPSSGLHSMGGSRVSAFVPAGCLPLWRAVPACDASSGLCLSQRQRFLAGAASNALFLLQGPGPFHAGCSGLSRSSCCPHPRCRGPQPLCSPHFSRGPTSAVHL